MMETKVRPVQAKDTAMSIDELIMSGVDFNKPLQVWVEQSFKLQAEISFPLGKVEGRREVIEWTAREFGVDWSEEQEQLKIWGIKL